VVAEALADGPPLRIEHLEHLEAELRAHIGVLLPAAEQHVDGLWPGDVVWHQRRTALDAVPRLLAEDMGDGLASAAKHVRSLARTCGRLLDYTQGAE
jgi:hypothetical protein